MKQVNPKQIHTKTDKISSNNGNNKTPTTMIEEDRKKLLRRKAGYEPAHQPHIKQ